MTAGELTMLVELFAVRHLAAEAVRLRGPEDRLRQLQEELAELTAAVNRDARGREGARENMIEELGQVFVLLMQAREIVGHEAFAASVRAAEIKTRERLAV